MFRSSFLKTMKIHIENVFKFNSMDMRTYMKFAFSIFSENHFSSSYQHLILVLTTAILASPTPPDIGPHRILNKLTDMPRFTKKRRDEEEAGKRKRLNM